MSKNIWQKVCLSNSYTNTCFLICARMLSDLPAHVFLFPSRSFTAHSHACDWENLSAQVGKPIGRNGETSPHCPGENPHKWVLSVRRERATFAPEDNLIPSEHASVEGRHTYQDSGRGRAAIRREGLCAGLRARHRGGGWGGRGQPLPLFRGQGWAVPRRGAPCRAGVGAPLAGTPRTAWRGCHGFALRGLPEVVRGRVCRAHGHASGVAAHAAFPCARLVARRLPPAVHRPLYPDGQRRGSRRCSGSIRASTRRYRTSSSTCTRCGCSSCSKNCCATTCPGRRWRASCTIIFCLKYKAGGPSSGYDGKEKKRAQGRHGRSAGGSLCGDFLLFC